MERLLQVAILKTTSQCRTHNESYHELSLREAHPPLARLLDLAALVDAISEPVTQLLAKLSEVLADNICWR